VPSYPVKTDFIAKDRVSGAFKKMGKGADLFGNKSTRAFKKASKGASSFRSIVGGILTAGAIQRGLGLMSQGVREVTTEFIGFDDAVTKAMAKFPGGIKRTDKEFAQLGETARDVAKTTRFSATDAAGGLDFLAMAGFNAQQAMGLLPGLTDLAAVAATDLASASDWASDALGAFGLMTQDTAKLTQNLTRVNDVFAKGITSFNTDLEQLFETAKMAAPVFTGASQSIETFTAAAGVMASAGIKATLSGTQLRTAILNLTAPTHRATKLLKKMRVETQDSQGNMRDLFDILGDIEKGTKKMGTAQRSAALNVIFGKRAVAGLSVLLDTGSEKLKEHRKMLEEAGGAAKNMADEMRKSLGARLDKLKNNLIEVGLKVFDTFQDRFPGAIDSAMGAIQGFDVKKVTDGIQWVIDTTKDLIKFTGQVRGALRDLKPFIMGAVGAWGAYKAIMLGVMAFKFVAYAAGIIKSVGLLTAAQWAWNAALLANPIGITVAVVAVGIGLLIAAAWQLYDNWDLVLDGLKAAWEWIGDAFWRFVDAIKGGVLGLVDAFKNIFSGRAFTAEFRAKQTQGAAPRVAERRAPKPPPPRRAPLEAREYERQSQQYQGFLTIQNESGLPMRLDEPKNVPSPVKLAMAGVNR
jgi:TP901 family phage tail tape measure protein